MLSQRNTDKKTLLKAGNAGRRGITNLSKSKVVMTFADAVGEINTIMASNGWLYQQFRDLHVVCLYYICNGKGVTVTGILKVTGVKVCGSAVRSLQSRLKWFVDRGYIERLYNIYYPTDKALEVLKELI